MFFHAPNARTQTSRPRDTIVSVRATARDLSTRVSTSPQRDGVMAAPMLIRLDERDRAIFARCVGHAATRRWRRTLWTVITHLGGATCSITAAIAPLFFSDGAVHDAARHALLALVVSHLGVQLLKRAVSRPRPSKRETL